MVAMHPRSGGSRRSQKVTNLLVVAAHVAAVLYTDGGAVRSRADAQIRSFWRVGEPLRALGGVPHIPMNVGPS